MSRWTCIHCGTSNSSDLDFCGVCGSPRKLSKEKQHKPTRPRQRKIRVKPETERHTYDEWLAIQARKHKRKSLRRQILETALIPLDGIFVMLIIPLMLLKVLLFGTKEKTSTRPNPTPEERDLEEAQMQDDDEGYG